MLLLLLMLSVQPAYASTGSWIHSESSIAANSQYEVDYSFPDRIITNESTFFMISMKVDKLGGTTYGIVTDRVEIKIVASTGQYSTSFADSEKLSEGQIWGPLKVPIMIVDSDFKLNPGDVINAKVSIDLFFAELGHMCVMGSCSELLGSPFSHHISTDQDVPDINVIVQSNTIRTTEGTILGLVNQYLGWIVLFAASVTFIIFFEIVVKRGRYTVKVGGGIGRS